MTIVLTRSILLHLTASILAVSIQCTKKFDLLVLWTCTKYITEFTHLAQLFYMYLIFQQFLCPLYMLCCAVLSCSVMSSLCNPMDYSLPGSSVNRDSLGRNTGVGCHALLQGSLPTQGANPGLLHCRQILYCLSH